MHIAKIALGMILGFSLLVISNIGSASNLTNGDLMDFVYPLPDVPQKMVAGEETRIDYNLTTVGGWSVLNILSNYDNPQGDIVNMGTCPNLPKDTTCIFSIKIAPKNKGNLSLRLRLSGNDYTVFLNEPRTSAIEVIPVRINTDPISQIVKTGNSAKFTVDAIGRPIPLKYQWQKNGIDISQATSSTYIISHVALTDAGQYTVMVSTSAGDSVTSKPAALTVVEGPFITTQPISQIIATGKSVEFKVVAGGTPPLTYQWKKDGTDISGATADTYSISAAQSSHAGKYAVLISNDYDSTVSVDATLQVGDGPVINTHPISQIIATDKPVTFSVDATGLGELKYQWIKNGAEISGAINKDYTIPKTAKSDAGDYQVKITDGTLITVTSNTATLQVGDGPVINTNPISQIIATDKPVTFSVDATGLGELKYQWIKNGAEISGAINKDYTIPKTAKSDAGDYQVKVTDGTLITVTSNTATLQVGDGPVINTHPISQIIATDKPATFSVDATGLGELKYQWIKNGVEISGAVNKDYSIPKVAKLDSGDYQVKVTDGTLITVTSNTATLQVGDGPVINTHPISQIIATDKPVTFSVTATGLGELKYQWMKGGVEISGATNKDYNIPKVAKSDAGDYQVKVTDGTGITKLSDTATLQVGDGPVINTNPISQIIATDNPVTFSVSATGLGELKYQWMKGGVEISGATNKDYNIPKVAKSDAGDYQVKITDGTLITVTSNTATLQVGDGPVINTHPVSQIIATDNPVTFSVSATGLGELKYQWIKNGAEISGAINKDYTITNTTKSDAGDYQVKVTDGTLVTVTSNTATLQVGDGPVINTNPISQIIATDNPVTFSVSATGLGELKYQWMKGGVEISGATNKDYNIPKVAKLDSGDYQVKVTDGTLITVTSNTATLQVGDGPVINTHPVSQIIATDKPVTFSVTASGLGELKYQWMKGGVEISGATSKDYNIPKVAKSDAGDYQVKITDGTLITVTSNTATLQVGDGPVINTHPVSQIIATDNPVTFSVSATGLGELKYQWIKNGAEISGAINKDYTITNTTKSDAGDYQVKVTDGTLITVTSNPATLQVGDGPVINTNPISQIIAIGKPATFNVDASGLGELKYQWMKNGVEISGAVNKDYSIPKVAKLDSGDYQVKVTDGTLITVTSNTATLQVGDGPVINTHPVSQIIAIGKPATFNVDASGLGELKYQWMKGGVEISGAINKDYTITNTTKSDAGDYQVKVTDGTGITKLSDTATLQVGDGPVINTNPISQIIAIGKPATFNVDASGLGELKYQWMKGGVEISGAINKDYTITNTTKSDAGDYQVKVTDGTGITKLSDTATLQVGDGPVINTNPISQIIATDNPVTFSVTATGLGELKYQWIKNGAEISGAINKDYTITNTTKSDAGDYQVKVTDGTLVTVTSNPATLQVGDGPVINTNPISQIIATDNPVTFSVTATGLGELKYQWIKNGAEISGAINKDYTITNTTKSDAGDYQVKVTDGTLITVTSNTATLQVGDGPSEVTIQPANQTIVVGQSATFKVTAKGTQPFMYQWKKNGVDIPGATSDTYITDVQTGDKVKYAVKVSNDYGNVTSKDSVLNALSITSITPTKGPAAGNTQITINGYGFDGYDSAGKTIDVLFDDTKINPSLVTSIKSTTVTFTAPKNLTLFDGEQYKSVQVKVDNILSNKSPDNFVYYDPFLVKEIGNNISVKAITSDHAGTIYIASVDNGVYAYTPSSKIVKRLYSTGLPCLDIKTICYCYQSIKYQQNGLYIGLGNMGGIYKYDFEQQLWKKIALDGHPINALFENKGSFENIILAAIGGKIFIIYDDKVLNEYSIVDNDTISYITYGASYGSDPQPIIVVTTNTGTIYQYTGHSWIKGEQIGVTTNSFYWIAGGLFPNAIYGFSGSNDGLYYRKNVVDVDSWVWAKIDDPDLSEKPINALSGWLDKRYPLYVGTDGDGIWYKTNEESIRFLRILSIDTTTNKLNVTAIVSDEAANVLHVGTDSGVYTLYHNVKRNNEPGSIHDKTKTRSKFLSFY